LLFLAVKLATCTSRLKNRQLTSSNLDDMDVMPFDEQ